MLNLHLLEFPPGPPSIENGAQGSEKLLIKKERTRVSADFA